MSASVNAASLPPGSQLSGSNTFASEPATPVRSVTEPTMSARRCQTDGMAPLRFAADNSVRAAIGSRSKHGFSAANDLKTVRDHPDRRRAPRATAAARPGRPARIVVRPVVQIEPVGVVFVAGVRVGDVAELRLSSPRAGRGGRGTRRASRRPIRRIIDDRGRRCRPIRVGDRTRSSSASSSTISGASGSGAIAAGICSGCSIVATAVGAATVGAGARPPSAAATGCREWRIGRREIERRHLRSGRRLRYQRPL